MSFGEALFGLNRRLRGSRAEMLDFQARHLRRVVRHAERNVPFYRRWLAGVNVEEVHRAEDLVSLPVVAKSDLRSVPMADRLAPGADPRRLSRHATTGSTGEPFEMYRANREAFLLACFAWRAWRQLGVAWRDRRVLVAVPTPRQRGATARRIVALRRRVMPKIESTRPSAEILAALRHAAPDVIHGYPGVLAMAAALAGKDGLGFRPRLVISGGEVLTPAIRRVLEQRFAATVRDAYSAHEFMQIAWECSQTGLYHVCDDTVALEILCDGRPAREGEEGDVVGTALHSYAMPFIRYKLGDRAVRGPTPCPCGRPFSTLGPIAGRRIDFYTLPDGTIKHHYELLYTANIRADALHAMTRYQLVQERADRFVLRVALSPGADLNALERLRQEVLRILGPGVELELEFVDESAFAPAGKFHLGFSKVTPAS